MTKSDSPNASYTLSLIEKLLDEFPREEDGAFLFLCTKGMKDQDILSMLSVLRIIKCFGKLEIVQHPTCPELARVYVRS